MPPRHGAFPAMLGTAVDSAALVHLPRSATTATSASTSLARSFSTTQVREGTPQNRKRMFNWLQREGRRFEEPSGYPQYAGPLQDQPFPHNPLFRSQPVLDTGTKDIIYDKVMNKGESIKAVSAEMHIDVRRVAAVVRMKEIEKQWIASGKQLAYPYAKAVLSMLPKTSWREGQENQPHEPINEILVHKATLNQVFVPVSESRHFTREDAAKAFDDHMLSADMRSPHRELIDMERRIKDRTATRAESMEKFREEARQAEEKMAERILKKREQEEELTTRKFHRRFEFRFKAINAEDVGKDGRKRGAAGWRYGAPLNDRRRGEVKIPTTVSE